MKIHGIKLLTRILVGITNLLKGILGIKSPSREFMGGNYNEKGISEIHNNNCYRSGIMCSDGEFTWSDSGHSGDSGSNSSDNSYD